jgi:MFS family permease
MKKSLWSKLALITILVMAFAAFPLVAGATDVDDVTSMEVETIDGIEAVSADIGDTAADETVATTASDNDDDGITQQRWWETLWLFLIPASGGIVGGLLAVKRKKLINEPKSKEDRGDYVVKSLWLIFALMLALAIVLAMVVGAFYRVIGTDMPVWWAAIFAAIGGLGGGLLSSKKKKGNDASKSKKDADDYVDRH